MLGPYEPSGHSARSGSPARGRGSARVRQALDEALHQVGDVLPLETERGNTDVAPPHREHDETVVEMPRHAHRTATVAYVEENVPCPRREHLYLPHVSSMRRI